MGQTSTQLNYHRRREAKRLYVQKVKSETPCADCQQRFHYCVMDFDHVRGKKRYSIGKLAASNLSLKYLLEELENCEVVCSNCHRIRTFSRKVWMGREAKPKRIRNTNARRDIIELEHLLTLGRDDATSASGTRVSHLASGGAESKVSDSPRLQNKEHLRGLDSP
jgi:hypothetical protein